MQGTYCGLPDPLSLGTEVFFLGTEALTPEIHCFLNCLVNICKVGDFLASITI